MHPPQAADVQSAHFFQLSSTMRRLILALAYAMLAAVAQPQVPSPPAELADLLSFEAAGSLGGADGWGGTLSSVFADDKIVHGGHWSVRLDRTSSSDGQSSTLAKIIAVDFAGKRVELRGFLRTENITEWAGLWMREDGETPSLELVNMQARQIKGTTDWTEYSIALPVHPAARVLIFGAIAAGTGKAWVDDLQLLVDGKPIWDAPKEYRPPTAIEKDHEFDQGSGIAVKALGPVQIENLVTLGKVWGFLKYHHPVVMAGQRHWDYELFRIVPAVLAAPDHAAANAPLLNGSPTSVPSRIASRARISTKLLRSPTCPAISFPQPEARAW
jgi:hypothetical protein